MLKPPDLLLAHGDVILRLQRIAPGDPVQGLVPYYMFYIDVAGEFVGHLSLRVGDTEHVRLYAGHIGYGVKEEFRGHHYAQQACQAVAEFAFGLVGDIVITCDPDNMPSRRTIESLGAQYDAEYAVPPDDIIYVNGGRVKRRYVWARPNSGGQGETRTLTPRGTGT